MEKAGGHSEHVLADLKGPGTITRFWSANPSTANLTRFYFDGEKRPRIENPFKLLFNGKTHPFGSDISYISGTGGNMYYPIPYEKSPKITVAESGNPLGLCYEIGYRTYESGMRVVTFDPEATAAWESTQMRIARAILESR